MDDAEDEDEYDDDDFTCFEKPNQTVVSRQAQDNPLANYAPF